MNTFIENIHPEELVEPFSPCDDCAIGARMEADCIDCMNCDDDDYYDDDEPDQFMSDVEADADALSSAGWGEDEAYGFFGYDYDNDF